MSIYTDWNWPILSDCLHLAFDLCSPLPYVKDCTAFLYLQLDTSFVIPTGINESRNIHVQWKLHLRSTLVF